MSTAHSATAGDCRTDGQRRTRRLLGSWVSDNILRRALLPALFCLCLSSNLFTCHAQPASQSEPSELVDQLKGMLLRRMADGFLALGGAAQTVRFPELAVPLYTSAHVCAVAGYGAASSVVATALMSRADSLSDAGWLEEALRGRFNPRNVKALKWRGWAYDKLSNTEKALDDYERVLAIEPRQ